MKQVIVVRDDIKMSKGKLIAQACHASLESFKNAEKNKIKNGNLRVQKKLFLK